MKKNFTALSFLWHNLKPFKFYVALHLFVVLYNSIDLSLWPYISKILIDRLATTKPEEILVVAWPIAALLVLFTVLPGFVWRLSDYAWMHLTPLMKKKIATESMEKAMQHSHNFFQNNFSGSIANKVRDLSNSTPPILGRILYSFLNVILSLIIGFVTLFFVHPIFGISLIIWAIIFTLMAIYASRRINPMSIDVADQQTKIMGNLVDILGNIANVRFFSRRNFEVSRVRALQDEYYEISKRRSRFLIKFYVWHGLSYSVYYTVCIVALISLYSKGLVTLGDFLLVFTINNWIIHLMWMSANEMNVFLEEVGTVNQALQIINQPIEIADVADAKNLEVKSGEIVFENVSFNYQNNSSALFSNKNITIKAGQKVGLVGHSGGGKTSFINLILRTYELNSGRILIDQQDISKVTQDSLRQAIALIPQDPSLFHRSLRENIAYASKKDAAATDEEIIQAAKQAHADEFIANLEQGYDSMVGERGVKLSGGQRQRIAIARAFLKNSPILILDEATSQLDSITENLIQDALQNLMLQKTTIVIAHRLSTLQHMDRILVFDQGKIVEDGSHQDLLALNGFYKKLWDSQVGGFLTENFSEK